MGIDPAFEITNGFSAPVRIFREESDAVFQNVERAQRLQLNQTDLAFIDGMHLAEYVVRDFINVERFCAPGCVAIIDDVYPEQQEMAERDRTFNAWCGDVYKIIPILKQYRPDLDVRVYEAFAGPYRKGVALISGLTPDNTALSDNLGEIEAAIARGEYAVNSIDALTDLLPVHPVEEIEDILQALAVTRQA